jgi:hypothetical protein
VCSDVQYNDDASNSNGSEIAAIATATVATATKLKLPRVYRAHASPRAAKSAPSFVLDNQSSPRHSQLYNHDTAFDDKSNNNSNGSHNHNKDVSNLSLPPLPLHGSALTSGPISPTAAIVIETQAHPSPMTTNNTTSTASVSLPPVASIPVVSAKPLPPAQAAPDRMRGRQHNARGLKIKSMSSPSMPLTLSPLLSKGSSPTIASSPKSPARPLNTAISMSNNNEGEEEEGGGGGGGSGGSISVAPKPRLPSQGSATDRTHHRPRRNVRANNSSLVLLSPSSLLLSSTKKKSSRPNRLSSPSNALAVTTVSASVTPTSSIPSSPNALPSPRSPTTNVSDVEVTAWSRYPNGVALPLSPPRGKLIRRLDARDPLSSVSPRNNDTSSPSLNANGSSSNDATSSVVSAIKVKTIAKPSDDDIRSDDARRAALAAGVEGAQNKINDARRQLRHADRWIGTVLPSADAIQYTHVVCMCVELISNRC